ncbi:hypothetical protein F4604DRAFT_1938888 [Suillus subluteus]|nr:hypothetical protein F4604DRAFT_1938888 [Suillus subluteus]
MVAFGPARHTNESDSPPKRPHRRITPGHGLLRTVPMGGGEFIDLQPDGNGFDMLKALILKKKE